MLVQKSSGRDHFSHVADVRGSRSTTLAPSDLCQDKCQPLRSPRLSRFQTGFPRKLRSSAAEVMGKVWFPDRRKPLFPGEWDSSKENTLMYNLLKRKLFPRYITFALKYCSISECGEQFRSHLGSIWGSDSHDGCVLFALSAQLRTTLYKQLTHSKGMFLWPSFHTVVLYFIML